MCEDTHSASTGWERSVRGSDISGDISDKNDSVFCPGELPPLVKCELGARLGRLRSSSKGESGSGIATSDQVRKIAKNIIKELRTTEIDRTG